MHQMRLSGFRTFLILPLLFSLITPALAQTASSDAAPAPKEKKKTGVTGAALPVLRYSPETRWAFGAGGVIRFHLGQNKEQTRPSAVWVHITYTEDNQLAIGISPDFWLSNDQIHLTFSTGYSRFPTVFFGIGNNVSSSVYENYTPERVRFDTSVNKTFFSHLYFGIGYHIDSTTIKDVQPGGQLAQGTVVGSQGGVISGLGIVATWDTRDNIVYPHRGVMFSLVSSFYSSIFLSDYSYISLSTDLRSYIPVFSSHILAVQAFFRTNIGNDVPFYALCQLGGSSALRGTFAGLYRDKTMYLLQAEYRMPVWWRFGAVAFAGLGEVCSGPGDFHWGYLKYSLGVGARFRLDREGMNLRLDSAWGEDYHAFYLTIQEAF